MKILSCANSHVGSNARRQCRGFTLIELLIALTVLVLLVGVLFAGLRMGDRTWRAVADKSSDLTEMRLVWRFIDDRVRDFQPVYQYSGGEQRILFAGTGDAIEFVTTSSYQNNFGGYYIIRLQLIPGDQGNRLALRQWLYQPSVLEGVGDIPEWTALGEDGSSPKLDEGEVNVIYSEAVLLEKVNQFSIEYWGATDNTENADWQNEWTEKIKVPALIKIKIKQSDVEWPELFFTPINGV